ncbi:MAG: phage major capsid protein [Actinomycetota bacterium]
MTAVEVDLYEGLPLRDRVEKLTNDAVGFEKKYDGKEMTADDHAKFMAIANGLGDLATKMVDADKAHGAVEKSQAWLRGMGADPDVLNQGEDKNGKLSGETGIIAPTAGATLGDRWVQSEAFAEFRKNAGTDGAISEHWTGMSGRMEVDGSLIDGVRPKGALVTTDSLDQNETIVRPTVIPMVDEDPLAPVYLAPQCTRIPVTGEGFKYPRLIARTNNAAFVSESSSTADTGDGTGGTLQPTPANGYAPESELQWDTGSASVENISHFIPVTRNMAADAPQIVTFINTFLVSGLPVALDAGLLNGSGNSPEIRGFLNATNPYTNMHNVSVGGGDRFQAILTAIATIRSSRKNMFIPGFIVINTQDYFSTEFLGDTDANGNWMFGGPAQAPGQLNPWGLRAVVTDEIPAGTQLIGDRRYAIIGDRQSAQLYMADQHKDWVRRGLLLLLAEMRAGFGLIAEEAFCTVTA